MAVVVPTVGALQAINALKNGVQIGGTTFTCGDGDPSGVMTALRIGDVYIDYTNGAIYVAGATGTAGWATFTNLASAAATFDVGTNLTVGGTATITGVMTAATASKIGGTKISTSNASPEGVVTGDRKGDLHVDYTNANLYVFAGTATQNTGWKLVTRAA